MSGLFNALISTESSMTVESPAVCEPTELTQGQLSFPNRAFSAFEEQQILERVHQEIKGSKYRAIRRVRCGFQDGVLTLNGSVPNFHCKQIAQEVVRRVSGLADIQNCLDVDYVSIRT